MVDSVGPTLIKVSNLEELSAHIFKYRKSDQDNPDYWLFRGVGSAEYDLVPKVGRRNARKSISTGKPRDYSPKHERWMLEYFKRTARPYLTHNPHNDLEWLAVAQHHGMPTRLLDWTESILVAAFFAIKSAGKCPAIHAVKNLPVAPRDSFQSLEALEPVMAYYPPHISPRITAQQSVFTVHKDPSAPFRPSEWHCILLTGDEPLTYRLNLDAVGMNASAINPDIDGLAEAIGWKYKWDRLPPAP